MTEHPGADAGGPSSGRGASCGLVHAFLLLLVGLGVCTWVGSRGKSLSKSGGAEVWVDPAALVFPPSPALFDPRWAELLSQTTARHEPFSSRDGAALARLRDDLAALPCVGAVERLEVDERSGLVAVLEFRRPVACIPVGTHFLVVDAQGVILPGPWPAPLRVAGELLPVLGPMADASGIFRGARAGDSLAENGHLDALDVALSMRENLSFEERVLLGRVVIDASRARSARPEDGGAKLLLEGRRMIVFGRAPSLKEPGELPAETKWQAVEKAIGLLREGGSECDWDLVDVRWDEPEIVLRNPEVARVEPRVSAHEPARSSGRKEAPRDDGKTRVR